MKRTPVSAKMWRVEIPTSAGRGAGEYIPPMQCTKKEDVYILNSILYALGLRRRVRAGLVHLGHFVVHRPRAEVPFFYLFTNAMCGCKSHRAPVPRYL